MTTERAEDGPQVTSEVYSQLKDIARRLFADERTAHTLQPTAIVHEAFLKLVRGRSVDWSSRAAFLAQAATAMRHLLVDHARARRTAKRGHGARPVTLDERLASGENRPLDLLALDEALQRLARLHARQHRVVELRFFGGLTIVETAHVLGVGTTTVEDDWAMARAWLTRQLGEAEAR